MTAVTLPGGIALKSILPLLNEYRRTPARRKGTAAAQTLESLITLTKRFMDPQSCLFASRAMTAPKLTAVINYNAGGAETIPAAGEDSDVARHGDHRVMYSFPLSEEWEAWNKTAGAKMTQGDFSEFLEDRIREVVPPPSSGDLTDARFPGVADFAAAIGGTWAGPAQLMDLSRGLAVRVNSKIKDARNLSSGEAQIQYETEHADANGAPLKVPSMFMIAIPVFDGGPAYRIVVRLRYRVSGASISWFYEPWRLDLAFKHAFDEACRTAAEETGLPMVYGDPEPSKRNAAATRPAVTAGESQMMEEMTMLCRKNLPDHKIPDIDRCEPPKLGWTAAQVQADLSMFARVREELSRQVQS